jgi:hypothetical protein
MNDKNSILKAAAAQREQEVIHYQINIDNYRLAIAEIEENHSDEQHMLDFANNLKELLTSSLQEQAKEKVLLKVIKSQLKD